MSKFRCKHYLLLKTFLLQPKNFSIVSLLKNIRKCGIQTIYIRFLQSCLQNIIISVEKKYLIQMECLRMRRCLPRSVQYFPQFCAIYYLCFNNMLTKQEKIKFMQADVTNYIIQQYTLISQDMETMEVLHSTIASKYVSVRGQGSEFSR